EALQSGVIVNDVVGCVHSRAQRCVGKSNAVIAPIEDRDFRSRAPAVFACDMDDSVIEEGHAAASISSRGAVSLVQEDVVYVVENIVDDGPVRVLADVVNAAGDGTRSIERIVGPSGIPMRVHKDVAFDPGVRAVEVEMIVGSAVEDVVDDLEDGTG